MNPTTRRLLVIGSAVVLGGVALSNPFCSKGPEKQTKSPVPTAIDKAKPEPETSPRVSNKPFSDTWCDPIGCITTGRNKR